MDIKSLIPFGRRSDSPGRREENHVSALQREVNSLFDDFFRGFDIEPFQPRGVQFMPKIDIVDSGSEIKIAAELPGMDEKDVDVSLSNDILTIKGEKKEESEDKGKDYYRLERSYGSFCRTIALPAGIEADKIQAKFKNGVLTVTLPKAVAALNEGKKIPIKTE